MYFHILDKEEEEEEEEEEEVVVEEEDICYPSTYGVGQEGESVLYHQGCQTIGVKHKIITTCLTIPAAENKLRRRRRRRETVT